LIALFAAFSLILIVGDRVTATPATTALLLLAIGCVAIMLMHGGKPQPVSATVIAESPATGRESAAPNGADLSSPAGEDALTAPELQPSPPVDGNVRTPSITISLELPEDDVKILRRLAVLLRESD
jgi:hypothetical protein